MAFSKSPNGRYVLNGTAPFPILGRTAWGIVAGSQTEITAFLDDTVAKGYNCIEFGVIWHDSRTTRAPFASNSTLLPFTTKLGGGSWTGSLTYGNANTDAPDFNTPTTAYWNFIDTLINDCESRGILVLMFPCYHGFQSTDQGWQVELVANGTTKMGQYGTFIANRYKNNANIVWMIGGDAGSGGNTFTTPQLNAHQALIDGMKGVSGQLSTFISAEWDSPSIFDTGSGQFTLTGGSITYQPMQGAYDFDGAVATQARAGWSANNGPTYLMEEPFDEEGPDGNNVNSSATQPVRRFQWWGWLSAIAGYNSGNGFVWPFNNGTWQSHINTTGAQNQAIMNAFIKSYSWWKLIPSGLSSMRTLVVANAGSGSTLITASCASDGTLLIAYKPPSGSSAPSLDLRSMSGNSRARKFDPTNGTYTDLTGGAYSLANSLSSQAFSLTGNNAAGEADWVLVLDTPAKNATVSWLRA